MLQYHDLVVVQKTYCSLQRQKEELLKQRLEAIRERKEGKGMILVFLTLHILSYIKTSCCCIFNTMSLLPDLHAIKTYVRTKSGRLVERIVFLNDEDYKAFKAGGKDAAEEILKKYLSKDEAKVNIVVWS